MEKKERKKADNGYKETKIKKKGKVERGKRGRRYLHRNKWKKENVEEKGKMNEGMKKKERNVK